MIYLIAGIIVYAFISVYCILNGTFKETTNFSSKILTYFTIMLMILIFLLLPFFTYGSSGVTIVLLFYMASLKFAQDKYESNAEVELDGNGKIKSVFRLVKYVYIFVYTPLLVLYAFRLHNTFEMIFFSIVTLIVLYGIAFLFQNRIQRKKSIKFVLISFMSIIFVVSIFYIVPSISSSGISKLDAFVRTTVHKKNKIMYGYSTLNLASIEDGSIDESLLDFYIDDDYVYYVLDDDDDNNYVVKVYSLAQEQIVFEELIPNTEGFSIYFGNSIKNDFFQFKEGNLYCFTSAGIYTLNNLELSKVSDLTTAHYSQFYMDDELYIYSTVENQSNEIYKIGETITLVDTLSDTSGTVSVVSNKLIIDNGTEIRVYGTDITYPYPSDFDKPIYITDSNALFTLIDDGSFLYFYDKYGYVNEVGETKIFYAKYIQKYSNTYSVHGEYFYKTYDRYNYGSGKVFFDDSFKSLGIYKLDFVNTNYDTGYYTVSRSIDDKYIFVIDNYTYKDQAPLFFEVNELVKEETSITIPFSNRISLFSYFLALFVTLMPTNVIKKEKEKDEDIIGIEVTEII